MIYLIIWVICGLLAVSIASNKGQNTFSAFLVGVLLGPLGVILVAVQKTNTAGLEQRQIASGEHKKCPRCAETVKADALVCKHCGHEFAAAAAPALDVARIVPNGSGGYVCSLCQGGVREGATSCKHCGKPMFKPAATYMVK